MMGIPCCSFGSLSRRNHTRAISGASAGICASDIGSEPGGLVEFRRGLLPGGCAAVCVISTPDRAPMAGILADVISRFLPQQRQILYLSFALADPKRLEHLLASTGFRDIRVERETREYVVESFDDYWTPIEAG